MTRQTPLERIGIDKNIKLEYNDNLVIKIKSCKQKCCLKELFSDLNQYRRSFNRKSIKLDEWIEKESTKEFMQDLEKVYYNNNITDSDGKYNCIDLSSKRCDIILAAKAASDLMPILQVRFIHYRLIRANVNK